LLWSAQSADNTYQPQVSPAQGEAGVSGYSGRIILYLLLSLLSTGIVLFRFVTMVRSCNRPDPPSPNQLTREETEERTRRLLTPRLSPQMERAQAEADRAPFAPWPTTGPASTQPARRSSEYYSKHFTGPDGRPRRQEARRNASGQWEREIWIQREDRTWVREQ
jgi:hypothetical protein